MSDSMTESSFKFFSGNSSVVDITSPLVDLKRTHTSQIVMKIESFVIMMNCTDFGEALIQISSTRPSSQRVQTFQCFNPAQHRVSSQHVTNSRI